MLELKGVSKTFGGVKAVQNVSMSIASGEVRGLIGPNGAGKSTLVNLISGLLRHSTGTISVNGKSVEIYPPISVRVAASPVPFRI